MPKKKTKIEKVGEGKGEDLDIIQLAKQEQKQSVSERMSKHGKGEDSRPATKEVFRLWLTLPDQFKGAPDRIVEMLGITDPITIEVLKIKTMLQFAAEFGVLNTSLSRWRRDEEQSGEFMASVKGTMRKFTKNVMGALYRKMLEEGDAQRFTAWMKIVEDWREQLGVDLSGKVGDGLTAEEKMALERLRIKNTYGK